MPTTRVMKKGVEKGPRNRSEAGVRRNVDPDLPRGRDLPRGLPDRRLDQGRGHHSQIYQTPTVI